VEGSRKVLVLHEFHLLDASGAARLLKTLEEPPASAVFVVLADQVPPELVTIASRCVRIDFTSVADSVVRDVLVAEGVPAEQAELAAHAAEGNLTRARVLASDPELVQRRAAFASIPNRLDGTGTTVVRLCGELNALIEAAAGPLTVRQTSEVEELEARVAAMNSERGSGRKQLEERHKREQRRHRTDELRSGLAVVAGTYRDALVAQTLPRPDAAVHAVQRVHQALDALERNPNETLLLQALLLDLPSLPSH
jgi:DNA polymerase-3 subunit delta'